MLSIRTTACLLLVVSTGCGTLGSNASTGPAPVVDRNPLLPAPLGAPTARSNSGASHVLGPFGVTVAQQKPPTSADASDTATGSTAPNADVDAAGSATAGPPTSVAPHSAVPAAAPPAPESPQASGPPEPSLEGAVLPFSARAFSAVRDALGDLYSNPILAAKEIVAGIKQADPGASFALLEDEIPIDDVVWSTPEVTISPGAKTLAPRLDGLTNAHGVLLVGHMTEERKDKELVLTLHILAPGEARQDAKTVVQRVPTDGLSRKKVEDALRALGAEAVARLKGQAPSAPTPPQASPAAPTVPTATTGVDPLQSLNTKEIAAFDPSRILPAETLDEAQKKKKQR